MIRVEGLTKNFGKFKAVDDLSFEVGSGEVFGLLGPNGAGKTTTLRMLATLLIPSSGTATIAGFDIAKDSEQLRRSIGVVNGGMGLYDRLTGTEILTYFGKLYSMSKQDIKKRIVVLDELLQLGDTLYRRASDFSTGMKQKIVIARAVLHDPPVIFFDEATSGLDVMARRAVLNFVTEYPTEGRAVIYSTHVMSEVDELCHRAAIIYQGKMIAVDTIDGLRQQTDAPSLEQAFFRLVERSQAETDARSETIARSEARA